MSRNIKINFKNLQNKFLRTISKIDNKDIDLLSLHHKSNSNNTTSDCLSFFYNNENHQKNKLHNYNTKKNNTMYHNYSMNKENNSLNQTKKLSRSKSKTKNTSSNKSNIKRPHSASKNKNIQKNKQSLKYSMNNNNIINATKIFKKENKSNSKSKIIDNSNNKNNKNNKNNNRNNNILINNTHNSKSSVKIKNATKFNINLKNISNINNNINNINNINSTKKNTKINKTSLNTPIDSDRKDEQIMNLNKEIKDKEIELYELRNIYSNKQNYIKELENKLSSMKINKNVDEEYEKYSKIVMQKNVKMLTTENENLHKQIKEYKEKDLKMMKVLYNLQKKGIKFDDLIENEFNENDDKNNLLKCDEDVALKTDTTINTFTPLNLNDEQKNISCKSSINLNQNLPVLPLGKINDYYNEEYIVKNQNDNIQIQITNNYDCNIIKPSDFENHN